MNSADFVHGVSHRSRSVEHVVEHWSVSSKRSPPRNNRRRYINFSSCCIEMFSLLKQPLFFSSFSLLHDSFMTQSVMTLSEIGSYDS